jgi:hypothetical protein
MALSFIGSGGVGIMARGIASAGFCCGILRATPGLRKRFVGIVELGPRSRFISRKSTQQFATS